MKRMMMAALAMALVLALCMSTACADAKKTPFENENVPDAARYAMYCNAITAAENGLYSLAVENLVSLGDYYDSELLVIYYTARSLEDAQDYEEAEKLYQTISLFKDSGTRTENFDALILERDYARADALESRGSLESAMSAFKKLGRYKDSAERAAAIQEKIRANAYAKADQDEQNNRLEDALEGFKALGSYSDSAERAAAVQEKIDEQKRAAAYEAADKAEQEGDYAAAYSGFSGLGDYRDSAERAAAVQNKGNYAQAMQYAMKGQYSKAYELFDALGDYEDSREKAYVTGVSTFASKLYDRKKGTAVFQFHGVWGVIDVGTNTTTSPVWDEIGDFNSFDLAQVKKGGRYGYINRQGQVVVPCEFYSVSEFDKNGFCTVAREEKREQGYRTYSYYYFGLYSADGRCVEQPTWRTLGSSNNDDWNDRYNRCYCKAPVFNDGKIKVQDESGLWGFIDMQGSRVGEVRWTEIGNFSEGLAAVSENGKFGYIDAEGAVVIQPQYAGAGIFSEGLAWVKTDSGLWQCIDAGNQVKIAAKYSQVTAFRNGVADVELPGVGWQIIDATGSLIYFKN